MSDFIPYLYFSTLVIICLYWLYLILKLTVFRMLKKQKNTATHTGKIIDGKISKVHQKVSLRGGKMFRMQIEVEFPNFSGSTIKKNFYFVDSQPELLRYEKDKRIQLNVDENNLKSPVSLRGGKINISSGFKFITLLLLGGFGYGMYVLYSKIFTAIDNDVANFETIIIDSTVMTVAMILIGSILFTQLVFKGVLKISGMGGNSNSDSQLLYYGITTKAQITDYQDTNVTINNQPIVRYNYTFTDERGNVISGSDKATVGRLEIGRVHQITEMEIIYDKDNPSRSRILANLKENSAMSGCVKLPVYLIGLILSGTAFALIVSQLDI